MIIALGLQHVFAKIPIMHVCVHACVCVERSLAVSLFYESSVRACVITLSQYLALLSMFPLGSKGPLQMPHLHLLIDDFIPQPRQEHIFKVTRCKSALCPFSSDSLLAESSRMTYLRCFLRLSDYEVQDEQSSQVGTTLGVGLLTCLRSGRRF